MVMDTPAKTFSVTLNGITHTATYAIQGDVISVVSESGTASASVSDESSFATAITLLSGILRCAE
jgi:hypothetical protein